MRYLFALFAAGIWLFWAGPGGAEETKDQAAPETQLCAALADPQNYEGKESYRLLVAGRDGWVFRTGTDFKSDFTMNSVVRERFERLNRALARHDIRLVIALLPTRGMMHAGAAPQDHHLVAGYDRQESLRSLREFMDALTEMGLVVAGVTDYSVHPAFFYKRDHHWNADGARATAQALAGKIKALPEFSKIPARRFVTEEAEPQDHHGSFNDAVEKICGSSLLPEKAGIFRTYAEKEDLFSTQIEPEIILLGTSNSTAEPAKANFAGFLREALGADVKNMSISGGGIDSPLFAWLNSEDFLARKPKIVIWEIPAYVSYKNGPMYRQAIPATYGACVEAAVDSRTVDLDGPAQDGRAAGRKMDLFDNLEGKNIQGGRHYVHLVFDTFRGRKFKVRTDYVDGKYEIFDIRRDKRYPHDGNFYFEFAPHNKSLVSRISLAFPKPPQGTLKADICAYPQE